MALFDSFKKSGFGNINLGGITSGKFSLQGNFNFTNPGDKLASQANGPLKQLYQGPREDALQYPQDLDDVHYILFNITQRVPNTDESYNMPLTQDEIFRTIALPIPANLSDDRGVTYNGQALGVFGGAGASGEGGLTQLTDDMTNALQIYGGGAIKDLYNQAGDMLGDIFSGGDDGTPGGLEKAATLAAGAAIGSRLGMTGAGLSAAAMAAQYGQGYAFKKGAAYNPRMAQLFDNVNFREFSFAYRMIARNAAESEQIDKIIKTFQYHMLPSYNPDFNKTAFDYPNEFRIEFSQALQKNLFTFLPAVLTNVSVKYNSEGQQFFEETNAPVIVDITLQFRETQILTKDMFEKQGGLPDPFAAADAEFASLPSGTAPSVTTAAARPLASAARMTPLAPGSTVNQNATSPDGNPLGGPVEGP